MLLKNTEILDSKFKPYPTDIRLSDGKVSELGLLAPLRNEKVIDGKQGLIIPGLNDHHAHIVPYAASLNSIKCGPPEVKSPEELILALKNAPGSEWLRGIGFHESISSEIDGAWLDKYGPNRPIRIQHRSGRLWIFNSLGEALIRERANSLAGQERRRLDQANGKLYDVDELISNLTRAEPPPLATASQILTSYGVTGINDMTPTNDPDSFKWFNALQIKGDLRQKILMSGRLELSDCRFTDTLAVGSTKVHLHDNLLPDFDEFVDLIKKSRRQMRGVAVHCVTEVALVFTLAAMRASGYSAGNRIEHASVVPTPLIDQLKELDLAVVTQPNFVHEKGDNYLKEIPAKDHDYLYRCRSLIDAGVPLAFGTDMPFGKADPWKAMQAATNRQTLEGHVFNGAESITPEQALGGFLGELGCPNEKRKVTVGSNADLCLLDAPWCRLRSNLDARHVKLTIIGGEVVYSRDERSWHVSSEKS